MDGLTRVPSARIGLSRRSKCTARMTSTTSTSPIEVQRLAISFEKEIIVASNALLDVRAIGSHTPSILHFSSASRSALPCQVNFAKHRFVLLMRPLFGIPPGCCC